VARLLILTLSSGEAALPVLLRQLTRQSFQDFEHEVISGLPNQAAHNRLYRTIMARTPSFEFFLKLDADMTFRTDTALADVVSAVQIHPAVQHFAFQVWDCFTEEETLGVHLFRSGVTWGEVTDDLFVDPDPPGATQMLWQGPPAPFLNHGEVVSDFDAFSFGVHKFLKVAQRGRPPRGRAAKAHKSARHMHNCARIRTLYRQTHARRHRLALTGVMWAMEHGDVASLSSKSHLQAVFDREISGHDASWGVRVEQLSQSLIIWRLALARSLGLRRAFA
jgi:hypothetical protein